MKTLRICILVILIFFTHRLTALCAEKDYLSEYEDEYTDILMEELPQSAIEILEGSGIDGVDFESILSAEPRDIIDFFRKTAEGTIKTPLKSFVFSCVILAGVSIAYSYMSENEKKKKAVNLIIYAYIAISICIPMSSLISAGAAAIKLSSNFMLVLLPVLAGVIAAAKNPLLAVNYNSVALYLAETISVFSSNILLPLEGMFFALVCVNIVSDTMRMKNLALTIKNTVTKTLSFSASIFVAVLSIKGILSNIADTVTVKGAKMLVNSLVPVIGGSMSDAYATIVNSLILLKSSVGVFGIAAIAAVNLPVIFEFVFWSLSLTASSVVADVFGHENVSSFYRDVSNTVRTFNVILIFCCVLFIISTGILLTIKNSV